MPIARKYGNNKEIERCRLEDSYVGSIDAKSRNDVPVKCLSVDVKYGEAALIFDEEGNVRFRAPVLIKKCPNESGEVIPKSVQMCISILELMESYPDAFVKMANFGWESAFKAFRRNFPEKSKKLPHEVSSNILYNIMFFKLFKGEIEQ